MSGRHPKTVCHIQLAGHKGIAFPPASSSSGGSPAVAEKAALPRRGHTWRPCWLIFYKGLISKHIFHSSLPTTKGQKSLRQVKAEKLAYALLRLPHEAARLCWGQGRCNLSVDS